MKSLKKMTPTQVLTQTKQIRKYERFDFCIKLEFYNDILFDKMVKIVDKELTTLLIFMIENLSGRV